MNQTDFLAKNLYRGVLKAAQSEYAVKNRKFRPPFLSISVGCEIRAHRPMSSHDAISSQEIVRNSAFWIRRHDEPVGHYFTNSSWVITLADIKVTGVSRTFLYPLPAQA